MGVNSTQWVIRNFAGAGGGIDFWWGRGNGNKNVAREESTGGLDISMFYFFESLFQIFVP